MAYLEQAVTDFGGIALRYGAFYGAANDATIQPVRKRQYPIVGDGGGILSWIHLDDAAAATVLAVAKEGRRSTTSSTTNPPQCANGCRCSPTPSAPNHPGTPHLARASLAGDAVTLTSTQARGASNARAKRELGWTPRYRPGESDSRRSIRRSPSPAARILTRLDRRATRPARERANRTYGAPGAGAPSCLPASTFERRLSPRTRRVRRLDEHERPRRNRSTQSSPPTRSGGAGLSSR